LKNHDYSPNTTGQRRTIIEKYLLKLVLSLSVKVMRIGVMTLTVIFLAGVTSCGDEEGEGAKFNLQVNNGSGSGEYPAGQVVTVSANPQPYGKEFGGWTGDAALLDDATQMIAKLTMPA